jgi:hypothetical protein
VASYTRRTDNALRVTIFGAPRVAIFLVVMGVKHRVYYLVFAIDDEVDFYSCIGADISIFIGCVTSAPDGSSPRGYSRIFYSSIGSKFSSSSILHATFRIYFIFSS